MSRWDYDSSAGSVWVVEGRALQQCDALPLLAPRGALCRVVEGGFRNRIFISSPVYNWDCGFSTEALSWPLLEGYQCLYSVPREGSEGPPRHSEH